MNNCDFKAETYSTMQGMQALQLHNDGFFDESRSNRSSIFAMHSCHFRITVIMGRKV